MNLESLSIEEYLKLRKTLVLYIARFQRDIPYELRTFRQAAKRFKLTHQNLEQLIEDEEQLSYNIGIMIPQYGYGVHELVGDYTIEYDGKPLPKKEEKVIWRVYDAGFSNSFFAEKVVGGRAVEHKNLHAHCLACAKTELMFETGEKVDIRGWHKQQCGSFLKAAAISRTLPVEEF